MNQEENYEKTSQERRRHRVPLPPGGHNPQPTDSDLIRDLETENYLLREVNEALVKESSTPNPSHNSKKFFFALSSERWL